MAILDRLLPAWRHSDPDVRAAAVRELDAESHDIVATLARTDPEARVRREAVKRLADADVLLEVGANDANEDLRGLALSRAAELLVHDAVSDAPVEQCLGALARLGRASQFVAVASRAQHAAVRQAALERITEETAFAEVARRSRDAGIGMAAVHRLTDVVQLQRVAAGHALAEVALAALERIDDADALHAISLDQQAQKVVRKAARARLDRVVADDHPLRLAERHEQRLRLIAGVEALAESFDHETSAEVARAAQARWRELDSHGAADPGDESRFRQACDAAFNRIAWAARRSAGDEHAAGSAPRKAGERQRLCDLVDALSGPDTPAQIERARAVWKGLGPVDEPQSLALAARFEAAVERCLQRHERWSDRHGFHDRLAQIVAEAEKLVAVGDPRRTDKARVAVEKRWAKLAATPAAARWLAEERELQQRFDAAGEALAAQARARDEERARREKQARDRVAGLCERLEKMISAESIRPGAAERALGGVEEALAALRDVHGQERPELRRRLETARATLLKRVSAQTTAEEWKLWANADAQRKLIERAEALLESGEPGRMLTELVALDRDWKLCASAPRSESKALWDRFRTARNELRRRCDAFLAENQAKKEALCVAAERLADSTDWNATADEFRRLQAEWKEIGPVRRRLADALFERFRAPANAFFERRSVVVSERRERFQERLGQIQELRDAAVALADSSDWENAADEIKRLQGEWRRLAPRGGEAVQAVANEFRDACDRFFERYRRRDDIESEAKLAQVEEIVAGLEALRDALGGDEAPPPEEVARQLHERLVAWGRRGTIPAALLRPLEARVQAACAAIEAACPEDLEEAGFEVAGNVAQREKICSRLEKLVDSFAARAAEPEVQDLGQRLRLAMAANTIGGSAALPREQALRDDVAAAEKLRDKWERMSPVVGKSARALQPRFDAAREKFDELRKVHGFAAARGRGPGS